MTRGARSAKRLGRRPSNMWRGSTRWSSTEINVTCRCWRDGSGSQSMVSGLAPVARKPCRLSISSKLMEPDMSSLHDDHASRDPALVQVVECEWGLFDRVTGIEDSGKVDASLHVQVDELRHVPARMDRAAVRA